MTAIFRCLPVNAVWLLSSTMKATTVQCVLLVLSSCLLANAARDLQEGKPL